MQTRSGENDKEYEETKKEVLAELKKTFRPEFINRIDEIIVFHKLTSVEIEQIINLMLEEVKARLKLQGITLEVDNSAKDLIAKQGTDTAYGARPLRRAIQNMLEDTLAEAILAGDINKGSKVIAIADGEKIKIENQ